MQILREVNFERKGEGKWMVGVGQMITMIQLAVAVAKEEANSKHSIRSLLVCLPPAARLASFFPNVK